MTTTRARRAALCRPLRAHVPALALALALAGGLATGCSAGDDPQADRSGEARQARLVQAPAGSLPTTTTVVAVTGRLPADRRRRVKAAVARVVDGWLDAAYVGGEYPRSGGFRHAFPRFSSGAKDEARRDLPLLTNARLAPRISGVDVRRRELRLDVLAVRREAVGVTARVLLVFDTTGRLQRRDRVQGRLYLARREGRWQVFGYDISRGRS